MRRVGRVCAVERVSWFVWPCFRLFLDDSNLWFFYVFSGSREVRDFVILYGVLVWNGDCICVCGKFRVDDGNWRLEVGGECAPEGNVALMTVWLGGW